LYFTISQRLFQWNNPLFGALDHDLVKFIILTKPTHAKGTAMPCFFSYFRLHGDGRQFGFSIDI
jgi:hypothetical protein